MAASVFQLDRLSLGPPTRPRLAEVSLSIPSGVTAILGASGAGKTSLLNVLVGFERPDRGEVRASVPDTSSVRDAVPGDISWVPADFGLWPMVTVRDHLAGVASEEFLARGDSQQDDQTARGTLPPAPSLKREGGTSDAVSALLCDFELDRLGDCYPGTLSMGERSRLAVARSLATGARIQLMDEPLAHVDPRRLSRFWDCLRRRLHIEDGGGLVFSTHSPEVALREAEHLICMDRGRIVWAGPTSQLYHHPESEQAALFLGPVNWFAAHEVADWFPTLESSAGQSLSLRPERLAVAPTEQPSDLYVDDSRFLGSVAEVQLHHERTGERRTVTHRPTRDDLRPGMRVSLNILLACLCLLVTLGLSGCLSSSAADRVISAKSIRRYALPVEETSIPAPRGMTFGPHEELLILDNAGRVIVYDKSGALLRKWWMPAYSIGRPEGVCVLKDGRIAVADTHYHRVVLFNDAGKVVGMFGEEGNGPGEFIYPVAVTQDADGDLYVAEYGGNERVQKFTSAGEFLLTFGEPGTDPGQFQRASGFVWHDGLIYIADAINNRIQIFTDEGKFQGLLADEKTASLYYPYDICRAPDGTFLIAEYGAGRVTHLSAAGEVLGRYGTSGRGEANLMTPWGIAVSSSGKIAVADTGNRRVVELQL